MRIIAGQNRGLKLTTPKGLEVRPILDRVRESLFGILRNDVPEANVADLFAGTGVIGLEALSRGAEACVFVDRDAGCIATINENIQRAHLEDRSRVVRGDVFRSAKDLAKDGPFDLVFVDPPYRMLRSPQDHKKVETFVARLAEPAILAEDGVVVFRFPSDADVPDRIGPLVQTDQRRYGGMTIALLKTE